MNKDRIFDGDYSISTHDLPLGCRASYWRDHVSKALIGIDCTATDVAGLNVSLSYSQLGMVGMAELKGNRHVVERDLQQIRSHEKDSAFICLQLEGATHILQGGECMPVESGDVFYYATSYPYVHGNTSDIHTLIFDIPIDTMLSQCPNFGTGRPGKLSQNLGYGHLVLSGALDITRGLKKDSSHQSKTDAGNRLLSLLTSLLGSSAHGNNVTRSQMYVVLQAKALIEKNLDSNVLDCDFVAKAIGLSARQLNRIFEHEGTSVSRLIWRRRLERANDDLMSPAMRHVQVAEIAYRWGFSSAAHFSRVYRQHYGLPPATKRTLHSI
ncbi:helix-turn-helix domain-containing protein [Ferribacterium limneticum]|uniref:helix-turn-helix domain-containing protein n=1 Tax=Ferribacterium limneticum TaxID=76259 RepID=UPI001CFBF452|nr:helix-turn-helix domain-containing protein [Ferribacterium limneticum]UCV27066.1 helix-turn-helix domain-containing protein [Ferribacterium limneticum]UCV30983.1 helix-turn-helix domain-containing protein [Ferribacterium limneticum]